MLRWALPALVSYSLRWLAVVSHQRQMVLRPLQDQGDVAGMQYPFKIALCSLCSSCRKLQCCSLCPWHLHLDMLNGANQRAFLLPLCPSPTILKSCRPSRALALPPRVSALYAQDLSKAVRSINLHSPTADSRPTQVRPKASSQLKERSKDVSRATSVWNLAGW